MKIRSKIAGFFIVGLICSLVGLLILNILVKGFGVKENLANAIQLGISLQLNFILNLKYVWKDKPVSSNDFLKKWLNFHLVRGASFVVNIAVFALLNIWFSYNWSYGLTMGLVAILNYLGLEKIVFKKEIV